MTRSNKFGFAPVEISKDKPQRSRAPGPMGAAVRDAAESMSDSTSAKVAQRRQNAEDAKALRAAVAEGRMLERLSVDAVATDNLPRDRLELEEVARSDEMDELKASIRERGQKEPVEVYLDGAGTPQLKKGWRRLTALRQLYAETGEDSFATVLARIEQGEVSRIARYVDMVEENVVREDLTFAEMAQVAITAAQDPDVPENDPAELILRLYSALHKTKRSYIRSFVFLMVTLGDALPFPKAIARNLGVSVARAVQSPQDEEALRAALTGCATPEAQNAALVAFLDRQKKAAKTKQPAKPPRQKFEFFVGKTKVTARDGELRLVSKDDFANLPKGQLERAVKAFEDALKGPRIR